MKKSPIALFVYKRPEHTLKLLESLAKNEGANESELFIFCDGSKSLADRLVVSKVREIVKSRQWCWQVHITEREENLGLAQSIISGVTEICAHYGRVIALEDDLVLSPYFLRYMNDALDRYEHELKVMHISGYMFPVKTKLPETFFMRNPSCWGWATWQRAWQYFEEDSELLIKKIKCNKLDKKFSLANSYPFFEMLEQQSVGKINSWAIRWYASIFLVKGLCLYPRYSLVKNTGHDGTGIHCDNNSLFDVKLSKHKITLFTQKIVENKKALFVLIKFFRKITYSEMTLLDRINNKASKSIKTIKMIIMNINSIIENGSELKFTVEKLQEAVGRIEKRQLQSLDSHCINANEFRVFSQWGEDGIIQFLIDKIKVEHKIFVEFGVQNYTESNTRFLSMNNNWSGLLIDNNEANINYIKKDPIYWQYNLKAIQAFITQSNINTIIKENGLTGNIGLLSIDIDGNDYWIWEAINIVNPAIVIIEYNHRFGKDIAVTIPYKENFVRSQMHSSNIYFGASLKALYLLAQKKGYAFVGCNSAGNNAFFVRKDLKPDSIREMSIEEGYVAGKFRESRNEQGELNYLSPQEEQKILESLPLVYIE
ncbi:MAG: hypothetical protein RH949_18770 [Coleofasciculus sp. A1-SPW-01]|uniref:hypothetical protein n=1 Tax=Coleofasciculus sp. A1-SPW-01 TaxID=3070819 RepID=UPI0032F85AD2